MGKKQTAALSQADQCDMQMIEKAIQFRNSYQDFNSMGQDKCVFMLQMVIKSIREIYQSENILECMQAYLHDTEENSNELRKNILDKAYIAMDWDTVSAEFEKYPPTIQKKQFLLFFLLLLECMTDGTDKDLDYMRKVPVPFYSDYLRYGNLVIVRSNELTKNDSNGYEINQDSTQRMMLVSQWFDNYIEANDLEELLEWNFSAKTTLAAMLRYPYNYHLWLPVSQLAKAKRLGLGWQKILLFRNNPEDCYYVNPSDLSVGRYGDEGSYDFQQELNECFKVNGLEELKMALDLLTRRFYPKEYGIPIPSGLKALITEVNLLSK